MDRNWQANAVETTPDLNTLTSQGYPTGGNPQLGIPATKPGAAWYYMITEELRNLIVNAGLTPDHTDLTQLVQAFQTWQNFPTGTVLPWVSKTPIPDHWLIFNGQSLLKSDYTKLDAFINSDGSLDDPDDSNYLILPDMTGRVWQGCSSYNDVLTAIEAGLPNITGTVVPSVPKLASGELHACPSEVYQGAFSYVLDAQRNYWTTAGTTTNAYKAGIQLNAASSSSYYGATTKPQVDACQALIIIKA